MDQEEERVWIKIGHRRNNRRDTESIVCEDVKRRQMVGLVKDETTVAANDLSLREWLNHAYEECLDQAVYLRRAIQEIDEQRLPEAEE
jgi:K+/H+ antiporter YhaU regulatory subunit KhtT